MGEKTRDYLFDNYRALLIFFVVIGHTLSYTNRTSDIYPALYYFIYFFHMPAFMMVSGYFSKNVDKSRDSAVVQLLVPYLIMNVFCYIQGYYVYTGNGLSYPKFQVFQPIRGCWFLLCLFVYKIMLKDLVRVRHIIVVTFLIGILVGWSDEFAGYFSLSRMAVFSFFFILGYYLNEEHINCIRKIPKWIALLIIVAGLAFAWYVTAINKMKVEHILYRIPYAEGKEWVYMGLRVILYVVALMLSAAWLVLMSDKQTRISYIGQNTITVYVFHLFITRWLKDQEWVHYISENKYMYGFYVLLSSIILTCVLALPVFKKIYQWILSKICKILFVKNAKI